MRRAVLAKVPCSMASETIPRLMERGLVDKTAKISGSGDFRLVPVIPGREDEICSYGLELTEGPAYTLDRRSPQERISEAFSDMPDIIPLLPSKWEYVGDIVIVKMDQSLRPYIPRIGKTYAEILGASTICADISGVSGEFRRPSMEVIYGTETESVRLENGIRYDFDVTKVMFASGNTDERMRMRTLNCRGETVVDMFAGIGYFTLPIAKFTGAEKVIACEKNPESYRFLLRNIELNDVGGVVEPVLGDNRELDVGRVADRILMGYVQRTSEFLPKALEMIKKGGIIHYHDTFYVSEYRQKVESLFTENCSDYEILGIREVKSFAPSVSHYVADVRIL